MRIFTFASLCLLSAIAIAKPINPGLDAKWQFSLGALNENTKMSIRSTRLGDPETDFDLDDLGLDESEAVPQFGVRWRFANRWALNLAYSAYGVSGDKNISTSFNYDGITYPVNAFTKTDLDLDLFILSIDYAIRRTDTSEWGVGLGLHAIDFGFDIKGSLNDVSIGESSEDFLAPLPNIRLFGRHAFSSKLLATAAIGWLGLKIDKYDGNLLVGAVALNYSFSDRWSLGINYQFTDIDLDIDNGINEDSYEIDLSGFGLVLSYRIP